MIHLVWLMIFSTVGKESERRISVNLQNQKNAFLTYVQLFYYFLLIIQVRLKIKTTFVGAGSIKNMRASGAMGCQRCCYSPKQYGHHEIWGDYKLWLKPETPPSLRTLESFPFFLCFENLLVENKLLLFVCL